MARKIRLEVDEPRTSLKDGLILIWANSTTFSRIVGMVVLLLAAFSLVQSWYFRAEQERLMECQTEFVSDVVETIDARSEGTSETNQAVDKMIFAIGDAFESNGNIEDIEAALQEYEEERRAIQKHRADNPYPQLSLNEECAS